MDLIFHETISNITDQAIETANEWQNRPLKKFYTFLFADGLFENIRKDMETKIRAVYVALESVLKRKKTAFLPINRGKQGPKASKCQSLSCGFFLSIPLVTSKFHHFFRLKTPSGV
ncbi:MAG: hypothetical protein HFE86_01735 [Clostridiales bacterium]|nr:hypothetical protein [Clostridiales bacterium]